jgi:tRNA pseudouridine(38-40) synthase
MALYLFKIFYLGYGFMGFQRQPHGVSIENYVEQAFINLEYIESFSKNQYKSASRTDKGVNAYENIFQLYLNRKPNLFDINKELKLVKNVQIWAYTKAPDNFQLKPLKAKTYEYTLLNQSKETIKHFDRIFDFLGKHDFFNFIKPDNQPRVTICDIKEIQYQVKDNNSIVVEITADHFGWELIRRMLGYLADSRYYDISPAKFLDPSINKPSIKPAEPRFLVLKRIHLEFEFAWNAVKNRKPLMRVYHEISREVEKLELSLSFIDTFLDE